MPTGDDETNDSNAALSFNIYLRAPFPTKIHAFLISEVYGESTSTPDKSSVT